MELITADTISKGFGGPVVLGAASFRVLKGDAIGLVGPNGAGKTTLVRILAGRLGPDSGRLVRAPSLRIGYVEQSPRLEQAERVADYLMRRVEPVRKELTDSEARLAEATDETLAARLADYERATERFEAAGGYDALDRGLAVLSALGLDAGAEQGIATLSGGELSLLQLAEALVSRPDLLILDEPGNHLDYLGLAWLEQFLRGWQGALIVISHNRYLLDSVCRTIWHLESGSLTCYTGTYTSFRGEWERLKKEREHEFRRNDRKARDLELRVKELRSIASSQYNPPAQIMNKLGAAKRKLEETLEARGERPERERQVDVDLGKGASHADIALSFENLDLSVGGRLLLKGASLHIPCGERVALVGRNGCGKSSLLKRIVREGGWNEGPIRIGPSLKLGYLSQVPQFSHPDATLVEEVRSWGPLSVDQAFALVSPFLFRFEDLAKPLSVLSGGEQNRLQFAHLVYREASLLILDEPTNHMDIRSREAIEAALERFQGTLLVVSHDRYFLDGMVERVVELDEQSLVSYPGGFSEFFAARYPALPRLSGRAERRGAGPAPRAGATDWEAAIGAMESELHELRAAREASAAAGHREETVAIDRRAALLEVRIENAYRRWLGTEG